MTYAKKNTVLSWRMFHVHFKKCVFCVVWCVLEMLIGLRCFITLFKANILLIFFFVYLLCWLLRMSVEFSKHTLDFCISPLSSINFCFMCWEDLLWDAHRIVMSWWSDIFVINPLIFEIFLILKSTLLILKLPQLFFD